ncbi:hypothetical protein SCHPADRAFT_901102 [Schizopora paradoxa]|uniref:Protein BIG1 n=1 Tax=Schizopora paradoxa TaxID=27342 RepID=A0A0H2RZ03_9AGAM|nr:hypothetical protein SCHPADRAFT_901102 [Schizopora paradoxa]
MKLSSFSLVLASLGLAALQATASPIRVVMISSSMPPPTKVEINHFRFGLAAADASSPLPEIPSSNVVITQGSIPVHDRKHKAGCSSSLKAANWLRQKLGLPTIEPHYRLTHSHHHDAGVHNASTAKYTVFNPTGPTSERLHHKWHRPHSFTARLQKSLMMLGPWEGRAVAFVIGCGIGTLLRMLYVLIVVGYRSVRPGNSDDEEVDIVFEEVEVLSAPPAYHADQKIAIAEEEKPLVSN